MVGIGLFIIGCLIVFHFSSALSSFIIAWASSDREIVFKNKNDILLWFIISPYMILGTIISILKDEIKYRINRYGM